MVVEEKGRGVRGGGREGGGRRKEQKRCGCRRKRGVRECCKGGASVVQAWEFLSSHPSKKGLPSKNQHVIRSYQEEVTSHDS